VKSLVQKLKGFAKKQSDSEDIVFKKLLILIVALSCSTFGLIWSVIYYAVFGFGLTMILPLVFTVFIGIAIIISNYMADHRPLVYTQIILITWISALIQWSIGSMDQSGLVIAWSFLGPLGAAIFLSVREALVMMVMFIAIVIISAVFEPMLLGYPLIVSENAQVLFDIMNVGAASIVIFAAIIWFVNTIQFERGRSETLLQKIQTLFGQHVSKEIAKELISSNLGKTESKAYQVTIMFLDIRDFTLFADSRAPMEVANFQNIFFGALINIVRSNRGIVNQILGDGILAVFGAPVINETHAIDAVNAGFSMVKKANELYELGEIPEIKLGIGLHTGQIIAGEVGNEFRKFYALTGSNVIVASRI